MIADGRALPSLDLRLLLSLQFRHRPPSGTADNLYATVIHATTGNFHQVTADEFCAGVGPNDPNPVCVTEAQFAALLSQSAATDTPISVSSSAASDVTNSGNPDNANPSSSDAGTSSAPTDSPPVIRINGNNPAHVSVGETYNDLGATITGPQADINLGLKYFLNGTLVSNIQLDTSAAADTIDYVVTDPTGLTATSTRTVIVDQPSARPAASTSDATTSLPVVEAPPLVPNFTASTATSGDAQVASSTVQ